MKTFLLFFISGIIGITKLLSLLSLLFCSLPIDELFFSILILILLYCLEEIGLSLGAFLNLTDCGLILVPFSTVSFFFMFKLFFSFSFSSVLIFNLLSSIFISFLFIFFSIGIRSVFFGNKILFLLRLFFISIILFILIFIFLLFLSNKKEFDFSFWL